jgi:hypothetical protein
MWCCWFNDYQSQIEVESHEYIASSIMNCFTINELSCEYLVFVREYEASSLCEIEKLTHSKYEKHHKFELTSFKIKSCKRFTINSIFCWSELVVINEKIIKSSDYIKSLVSNGFRNCKFRMKMNLLCHTIEHQRNDIDNDKEMIYTIQSSIMLSINRCLS